MQIYRDGQSPITYAATGAETGPVMVWAHGWGQTHAAFLPLAESLSRTGRHVLVDFPGFGQSPLPPGVWGTEDYADAIAAFLRQTVQKPVIWIGHSFGCRVGIQLAAKYPDLVSGLALIAAAGLPRKRPFYIKLYWKLRISLFKSLKRFIPEGPGRDRLYRIFGSKDYQSAGPLRQIFVKVVNENLTETARRVACPVLLVYGTKDSETPLELGERFNHLIKNSELAKLEGLDHYSVLSTGRHQVAPLIKKFIEKNGI